MAKNKLSSEISEIVANEHYLYNEIVEKNRYY